MAARTLQGGPRQATAGQFLLSDYGTVDLTGAVDATPAVAAAHAAMYARGGGTLIFPAGKILIAGQVVLPNDGGGSPTGTAPKQPTITWQGQGGYHTGQVITSPTLGATRLVMTYTNATYNMAKVCTRGLGRFNIRDIVFQDTTASATTPFLFTTNTTLSVSGCAFLSAIVAAPTQDAIVLGGTKKQHVALMYDDFDAAFQGYGTVVENNYFNGVRRAVYGRSYCNHTVTRDNFMDKSCGTNLSLGACIEFNAGLDSNVPVANGDTCAANVVTGNYMNGIKGYSHQVKLVGGYANNIAFNGAPDQHNNASYLSFVGCYSFVDNGAVTRYTWTTLAVNNLMSGSTAQPQITEDTASTGWNTSIGYGSGAGNVWGELQTFKKVPTFKQRLTLQDDDAAWGSGNRFIDAFRPASYATDPGGVAWRLWGNGKIESRLLDSSYHARYSTIANVVHTEIANYGKDWNVVDQDMTLRAGTTTNNTIHLKAYQHKFHDWVVGAGAALRVTVGAGVDGLKLGSAADLTVQRDASVCLAINKPVKTQATTTGGRPSASTAGVGAQIYDTTLSMPIFSDGTIWRDAVGTAV